MQIWELHFAGLSQYAVLVPSDDEEADLLGIFGSDGTRKQWHARPRIEPALEKRKKAPKPRADISYLIAGAAILNQKAYIALKDFLLPFGQLLELDCNGEVEYFYNVTNLLPCIDFERSEKQHGVVFKEVFKHEMIPASPQIFKDPHTATTSIYVNQAAKAQFEQLSEAAGVFGARFVEAGQGLF